MNKMWKIFETTGNIIAYLHYRDYCYTLEKKERNLSNTTKEGKRA